MPIVGETVIKLKDILSHTVEQHDWTSIFLEEVGRRLHPIHRRLASADWWWSGESNERGSGSAAAANVRGKRHGLSCAPDGYNERHREFGIL